MQTIENKIYCENVRLVEEIPYCILNSEKKTCNFQGDKYDIPKYTNGHLKVEQCFVCEDPLLNKLRKGLE